MFKHSLVIVFVACLLCVGFSQERAKKKGPADFVKTIESAKKGWEEQRYGACIKDLQTCMDLVVKKRAAVIRAALPAAPEGWDIKEDLPKEGEMANPFLSAMSAAVGSTIERKYVQKEGRTRVDVTAMADSPMVQMLSMMFANPAAAGPNTEKITYGIHSALLQKQGQNLNLQILISDAHVVEARLTPGAELSAEAAENILFALFDQAAVDKLAAALAK